jgi:DnaK suppressor protein
MEQARFGYAEEILKAPLARPVHDSQQFDLAIVKQILIKRHDQLIGREASATQLSASVQIQDQAKEYFRNMAGQYGIEILEIGEAFFRIREGIFGLCTSCEEPIGLGRLKRLPYARLCLDCQREGEFLEQRRRRVTSS